MEGEGTEHNSGDEPRTQSETSPVEQKPPAGIVQQQQSPVCFASAIGEFDNRDGNWRDYIERFEFYCDAQGIADPTQRRALFLSGVGQNAYRRIKTILAPALLTTVSYQNIIETILGYFEPKPSAIVSRFRFHQKCQGAAQGIQEFVTELKVMADRCEFGPCLDHMLRDRFVCGQADQSLQKRLLTEEDTLTFDQAQRIALAAETAARGARQLTTAPAPDPATQDVNQVRTQRQAKAPQAKAPPNRYVKTFPECFRCGGTNHSAQTCRFRMYKCHSCGEQGHLSRKCRNNSRGQSRASGSRAAHCVTTDDLEDAADTDYDDESNVCSVFSVGTAKSPPITVEVVVYGVPVTFEVDTGSASTLMNARTFKLVQSTGGDDSLELRQCNARLRTYTGEPIQVEGEFNAVIHYSDQHLELPVVVVDTPGPNLLGRDWMNFLRLDWQTIKQVRSGGPKLGDTRHA